MLTCNKAGLISFGAAGAEGGCFGEHGRAECFVISTEEKCDYEQMLDGGWRSYCMRNDEKRRGAMDSGKIESKGAWVRVYVCVCVNLY